MIETTKYYEDFLSYYAKAKKQQELSNLGTVPHKDSGVNDPLMEQVHLYDVVERRYAGFSQIKMDIYYGWTKEHPYWNRMEQGLVSEQRKQIANAWTHKRHSMLLEDWIYLFILHSVTGSGINYKYNPSGYYNSIIFQFNNANGIEDFVRIIKNYTESFYTSGGYQFPQFPKQPIHNEDSFIGLEGFSLQHIYKRQGDYYLCEFAPKLARDIAHLFETSNKQFSLREILNWMLDWNTKNGLKRYAFQYAAVVADFADFFPQYVDPTSLFVYGTNARECLGYLTTSKTLKGDALLDATMMKIYEDLGALPYDAEDVACDYIRWVENYINPGVDYSHVCLDTTWNSSIIEDHPFGRQKKMLELGLVKTFNGITSHPSDDKILKESNLTVEQYKSLIFQ